MNPSNYQNTDKSKVESFSYFHPAGREELKLHNELATYCEENKTLHRCARCRCSLRMEISLLCLGVRFRSENLFSQSSKNRAFCHLLFIIPRRLRLQER